MICLNAILLGDYDFSKDQSKNAPNKTYDYFEILFCVFNVLEVILRSVARGIQEDETSYLNDIWEVLDFLGIIAGMFYYIDHLRFLSILRLLRTIKYMKNIRMLKNLKYLFDSLLEANL